MMITKVSGFRKKRQGFKTRKALGWVLLASVAILGVVLIFYNVRIYQKRAELQERASRLQDEIAELNQKNRELQRQLEISVTPEYQEKILREQGLYQKPGEEVVTVLPLEQPEQKEQKERVWWNPWTWFSRE